MQRGLLEAIVPIAPLWLALAAIFAARGPGHPDAGLLEALAGIGATFLIAYVVEVTWLVTLSQTLPLAEREKRLGALMGVAALVLVGIAVAVVLAARVNHWGSLEAVGLGFVGATLAMAGMAIVLQPLFTHEWAEDKAVGNSRPHGSSSS